MIDKLIEANNLIEDFKSAIMSNVIITIKDSNTHEQLWCCATDEYNGWLKEKNANLEIDQDIHIHPILVELKKLLNTIPNKSQPEDSLNPVFVAVEDDGSKWVQEEDYIKQVVKYTELSRKYNDLLQEKLQKK